MSGCYTREPSLGFFDRNSACGTTGSNPPVYLYMIEGNAIEFGSRLVISDTICETDLTQVFAYTPTPLLLPAPTLRP